MDMNSSRSLTPPKFTFPFVFMFVDLHPIIRPLQLFSTYTSLHPPLVQVLQNEFTALWAYAQSFISLIPNARKMGLRVSTQMLSLFMRTQTWTTVSESVCGKHMTFVLWNNEMEKLVFPLKNESDSDFLKIRISCLMLGTTWIYGPSVCKTTAWRIILFDQKAQPIFFCGT